MTRMQLNVKKLHPKAILPSYAHPHDAGLDLFAVEKITIKPGERKIVPTGIAMDIPPGYAALIWDKSGISIKHGIKTIGGVFDAGYTGEFLIGVYNMSDKEYIFEVGHKVAQVLLQKVENVQIQEVQELSDSSRKDGAFGSTGK